MGNAHEYSYGQSDDPKDIFSSAQLARGQGPAEASIDPRKTDPLSLLMEYNKNQNDPRVKQITSAVGSGQLSIGDAMAAIKSLGDPNLSSAALSALSTDSVTGNMLASYMTQQDPLTKGLFGSGGIQDQAQAQYGQLSGQYQQAFGNAMQDRQGALGLNSLLDQDRQALMGRDSSYGLQDSDLQAYAQGAGNITRLFGAQGMNLGNLMAQRGLGEASNGIANQAFSNLYGNQAEQLAGLQQQISQNRIATAQGLAQARTTSDLQRQAQANQLYNTSVGAASTAQQAVGQNQNFIQNLGIAGQNAKTNNFNTNLQGSENQYNQLAGPAGVAQQQQALQQQQETIKWAQDPNNPSNQGPSLGDYLGGAFSGLVGGVGQGLAAAAGKKLF